MLSKHKTATAIAAWLQSQLHDIGDSRSLRNDTDGIAIRVHDVRQAGTLVFVDVVVTEDEAIENFEFCVQVTSRAGVDAEPD